MVIMSTLPKKEEKKISLKGVIQISKHSFFVFRDSLGKIFLNTGKDEKLHRRIVQNMINSNPFISKILRRYHIKPLIDTKILRELTGGHMNDTCNIAMGVYSILAESLKNEVDKDSIKEASMLHDIGKVLIPSKIINKPARLNTKEKKIMNIHSTLGYELLKTQSLSEDTLALIKYHHQNWKHSGYPALPMEDKSSDVGVQIISIADKYSALRERRVYRHKLSRLDALLVLYKEVREGKILPSVFNALVKYAEMYDVK